MVYEAKTDEVIEKFDVEESRSFARESFFEEKETMKKFEVKKNWLIAGLLIVVVILSIFLIQNVCKVNNLNDQLADEKVQNQKYQLKLDEIYANFKKLQEDYQKLEQQYKDSQDHDHSGLSGIFKRIGDMFK